MALKKFRYQWRGTAAGDNDSIAAFLIATDWRVRLDMIKIMPQGATGASAPGRWQFGTHDAAGVASDDNAELKKLPPTYDADIKTTVRNVYTSEPSFDDHFTLVCHQQQQLIWTPPYEFFMEEATRWALKVIDNLALNVAYEFYFEE